MPGRTSTSLGFLPSSLNTVAAGPEIQQVERERRFPKQKATGNAEGTYLKKKGEEKRGKKNGRDDWI
jgi:hypothetical protein